MKKGTWIPNLASQVLKGEVSSSEALAFAFARVKRKPVSFYLRGLKFADVDHVFWGVIADVFINRVYLHPDFSIHSNGVVVDIGAHRGGFTSFAAIHTHAEVLAFEPHPDNFMSLRKLITVNKLRNVSAYNAAVGAKTGKTKLFLSGSSSRHSLLDHEAGARTKLTESIEIDLLSLNDCLKAIDHVDLLKMDCEGAEREILLNTSEETFAKINNLAIEVHAPVNSEEAKELYRCLMRNFPKIKFVKQSNQNYGYLYAFR